MSFSSGVLQAVTALQAGQLVAFPTETVYGLGADAGQPDAVRRIFALKQRPTTHPLIVHLAPQADLRAWAATVPDPAQTLIDAFWPGPLTLVLPKAAPVSDTVTGGRDTVGLRCPAHPVAQALLTAFGGGIAAPSANRFGRVSPTTAAHVLAEFGDQSPLVLDGGPCAVGLESTIVRILPEKPPELLRHGEIGLAQLQSVLGTMVVDQTQANRGDAPGTLLAHYAPQTPLQLVEPQQLHQAIQHHATKEQTVVVVSTHPMSLPSGFLWQALPQQPQAYAAALYATLRSLDAVGASLLLWETPPPVPEWAAITDRLSRAAAGHGQPLFP